MSIHTQMSTSLVRCSACSGSLPVSRMHRIVPRGAHDVHTRAQYHVYTGLNDTCPPAADVLFSHHPSPSVLLTRAPTLTSVGVPRTSPPGVRPPKAASIGWPMTVVCISHSLAWDDRLFSGQHLIRGRHSHDLQHIKSGDITLFASTCNHIAFWTNPVTDIIPSL